MKDTNPEPLRGEAAWRAAKTEIAKRNDEAQARGAARRSATSAAHAARQAAAERLEASNLPTQPHR